MTEYPKVDIYIETLKNQQDLALLFNEFNNNRYVLSKNIFLNLTAIATNLYYGLKLMKRQLFLTCQNG